MIVTALCLMWHLDDSTAAPDFISVVKPFRFLWQKNFHMWSAQKENELFLKNIY
jgi:hypothetical protein